MLPVLVMERTVLDADLCDIFEGFPWFLITRFPIYTPKSYNQYNVNGDKMVVK